MQQPGVVVEDRHPGRVLLTPGEVDAQVDHFRSVHPCTGFERVVARVSPVLVLLAGAGILVAPVQVATASPPIAPPVHAVSVTGTGVATYPAFDPEIARYGVTTTAATAGTLTVTASTSDPAGVVTVDGRVAQGGTRTVTGLTEGDEVAVFITDSAGTERHSFVYLPPQFPALERTTPDPAPGALAPGLVMLTLGLYVAPSPFFETAVDANGVPAFVREVPAAGDLKPAPHGRYSVFEETTAPGRTGDDLVELDSQWREVARHRTVGGLVDTDGHDAIVLPDGTVWLMAYEPNSVTGLIDSVIQEVEPDGSPGFTWSSADFTAETVTPGNPDYAHLNSLELLPDGDVLASFRHLSAVYRIATHPRPGIAVGDVVWKLGGRHSDFDFAPGDTGPCAQHTARMLPNGHVLMYDNGSWSTTTSLCIDQANPTGPPVERIQTRVIEYELDTTAHTATVVRSYEPLRFSVFAGSAQRLGNDNTMIAWASDTRALASEISLDGTLLWELRDPTPAPALRWFTYRAHKAVVPDATPPEVDVTVPADGATYVEGDAVAASYGCTDRGGSSLQSCTASPVDTGTPGAHTMTVTGVDGAGGTTTVTRHYTVLPASHPAVTARASRTHGQRRLEVRLQNDGARPDILTWSTRGGGHWRLRGPGTGTTPLLQPGEVYTFRLKARPPRHGRLRAKVVVDVSSTLSGRAASVTWRLKGRRG